MKHKASLRAGALTLSLALVLAGCSQTDSSSASSSDTGESAETATTCSASTPHGIIGCEAVTDAAASAPPEVPAPVTSGMLRPTSSMKKNEMPVATRCSVGVSMWRCFISMPTTKAGSSTSIWMLPSSP